MRWPIDQACVSVDRRDGCLRGVWSGADENELDARMPPSRDSIREGASGGGQSVARHGHDRRAWSRDVGHPGNANDAREPGLARGLHIVRSSGFAEGRKTSRDHSSRRETTGRANARAMARLRRHDRVVTIRLRAHRPLCHTVVRNGIVAPVPRLSRRTSAVNGSRSHGPIGRPASSRRGVRTRWSNGKPGIQWVAGDDCRPRGGAHVDDGARSCCGHATVGASVHPRISVNS